MVSKFGFLTQLYAQNYKVYITYRLRSCPSQSDLEVKYIGAFFSEKSRPLPSKRVVEKDIPVVGVSKGSLSSRLTAIDLDLRENIFNTL